MAIAARFGKSLNWMEFQMLKIFNDEWPEGAGAMAAKVQRRLRSMVCRAVPVGALLCPVLAGAASPQPDVQVALPPQALAPRAGDGQATLLVKGFRFVGNQHVAEEALLRDVPLIGQTVGTRASLAQIHAVAAAVTRHYRSLGYLVATAYVGSQDVTDGQVVVQVVEGALERSQVAGNARYDPALLKKFVDEALCGRAQADCAGATLDRSHTERAVGIVSDLPGVAAASGSLAPGGPVGTSLYTLEAQAGPEWVAEIRADNHGNIYTGRTRVGASLRLDNPAGLGDRLHVDLSTSNRGMSAGSVDYSLPLGYDGWRTGLSLSHSSYTLGEPFNATGAHGQADVLSANLSYPLVRSADANLAFSESYSAKWLRDSVLTDTVRKREGVFSLRLDGSYLDALAGGGLTTYGIGLDLGRLTQAASAAAAGTPGSAGMFSKLGYSLSRDQTLTYLDSSSRLALYGALHGQRSNRNLDSAEKFVLGGPDGVRAYPTGEATGDSGDLATFELRYSTAAPAGLDGSDLTLALFRDLGWLTVNHTPWVGYSGPLKRRLGGNGLSVELAKRNGFRIRLMWAVRDAGGELPTSDTSWGRSALWAQAILVF